MVTLRAHHHHDRCLNARLHARNDAARERKLAGLKPVRDLLALLGIIDQEIERLGATDAVLARDLHTIRP